MPSIPTITTGDDVAIPVTLKADGVVVSLSSAATVKARLVASDHESTYTAEVTQSVSATGADWPNGLVIVEFASADTLAIEYQGYAKLEVQADDGGKETWFGVVDIVKGNIA